MKKQLQLSYKEIIDTDNLLKAWREFLKGKRKRHDIQQFSLDLIDRIVTLHQDLANNTYQHGGYHAFNICDPKPRNIHKASVRDRLLHHAVHRKLYPFFNKTFIADSYSCQIKKGTHRALNRFRTFFYKVSRNNTRTCWVLKCDVRKFFASVNHATLKKILSSYIPDKNVVSLLENIIDSFQIIPGVGLPLGNLTSQLFVNVYMNELDQFVKHKLKAKYYIRYCDDFVIFSEDKNRLASLKIPISTFLSKKLSLELHPNKVFIKTVSSGVDFLGWTHFHDHRLLRNTTKRRMIKRVGNNPTIETLTSYLGLLKHGNTEQLRKAIQRIYYLNKDT